MNLYGTQPFGFISHSVGYRKRNSESEFVN